MNTLFKNTAIYAIGEILPKIVSFLLLPVFTRYLSTEEYGIVSYTGSVTLLLTVIGGLALNSYALRYYFEYKDDGQRRRMLGTVYSAIGIVNIALLVLGFLIFPPLIERFDIQVPWHPYFKLALINNFLTSFNIIPFVVYRVRQDSARYVALSFSNSMLTFLFNIIFVVFLEKGIVGYYYSTLIVNIPFFFIYANIIRKYATFGININYLKEGLRFSLPLLPGAIAYFFLNMVDRIILERNVPLSDIGIYNIAITLVSAMGIIIQSGYHAIEPEIFGHYGKTDYYEFIKKAQTVFFCAIFVAALLLALFSQEVFTVMTSSSFHKGYHLVPILVIGTVMSGQNVIYGGVLASEKRTKVQGLVSVTGAAFSFLFNIIFIPLFGVLAAALSRMLSYILMNTLLFIKMTFPGKSMCRESLVASMIFIIPHVVFYFCPNISFTNVVVKILLACVFVMLLLKLFNVSVTELKSHILRR